MALPARKWHTVEEYLHQEESAVERHEFHDGEILMMSGGSYEHSLICINILSELRASLKGSGCRVLESNMRIAMRSLSRYVYPDGTVVCGPPEFDPADVKRTTIMNPRVIVEALSPSTQAYDREEKYLAYQTIDSLREYVLVSTTLPRIETFIRRADQTWVPGTVAADLNAAVQIASLNVELALAEIYDGVSFPTA